MADRASQEGRDPTERVFLLENHLQAYHVWRDAGSKQKVLANHLQHPHADMSATPRKTAFFGWFRLHQADYHSWSRRELSENEETS